MRNNIISVVYIMPPKQKKEKPKTDRSVKAIAKTKKGSAQAQTTKVVVNVGERKSARRRRATAKPKGSGTGGTVGSGGGDGWLPPFNLSRSGSIFVPPTYNIPYISPPTYTSLAPQPSQQSFFTAPRPPPASFTERAGATFPELTTTLMSGLDSTFAPEEMEPPPPPPRSPPASNLMQEIQKKALETLKGPASNLIQEIQKKALERLQRPAPQDPKPVEKKMSPMQLEMLQKIAERDKRLVEAPTPTDTFAPAVAEAPTFVKVAEAQGSPKKKPAKLIQDVRKNITDVIAELGYSRDDAFKQKVAKDALGADYVPNKAITKYTKLNDAERILARLRSFIPDTEGREGEIQFVSPSKSTYF
jgi:hypothetical protein